MRRLFVLFALIASIMIASVTAANAVAGGRGEVLQFRHTNFGAVAVGDQECRTLVVKNFARYASFNSGEHAASGPRRC